MKPPARTGLGILFLVLATACFAVLDTSVKVVGASVSVLVAVCFRYVFQALAVSVVMLPLRGRTLWQTRQLRWQWVRGALLLGVSLLSFLSVQWMPVGEFTALVMTTPLLVTLLAALFLNESVSPLRWTLVFGGFAGALLIVRPGAALLGWVSLLPLLMVVSYALFQLLTAHLARTEDPMTMHFYTGWVGALASLLMLPLVWQGLPDPRTLALLCLVGLMGTVGHFLLILAFARTPASTLSPFLYTQIAFATACGWWVFGHLPDRWAVLGIVLIVACGVGASWLTAREKRLPS